MPTIPRLAPQALALFLLPHLAAPRAADLHRDELHGFEIEVPSAWRTAEQDLGEKGFVLSLLPPGSIGDRGVSVTVIPAPGIEEPEELLAQARERAQGAGRDAISGYEEWERELAGRKAPGLRARYRAAVGEFQLVQSFLVEDGRGYLLQRHAPVGEFDALAEEYEAVVESFAFVEAGLEARAETRLIELAARCGSAVSWAASWDEAAERARAEEKLVLVAAYMLPGFNITDTPRTSTFVDRDVVELVGERFVPLWYEPGMPAAFVGRYGMSATTFGQALLCVTPDGDVVLETNEASNPDVVLPFLHAALARHPELAGGEVDAELAPRERAARHVARGEHAAARALLEGDETAEAHLLRAAMLRRERAAAPALAALEAARAAEGRAPELEGELLVREAELRLRLGEVGRARELFERAAAEHAGTAAACEARLGLGVLDLPERPAEAKARWRALAQDAPESPFAWQAAAALRSTFVDLGLKPELAWPSEEALAEALAFPARAPLPVDRAGEAALGAVAWLLAAQRADGSWLLPSHVSTPEGLGPDPFGDATAALAGRALLAHGKRGGPEAEGAARRALAYLVQSVARRAGEPPVVLFMDYMTWSDALVLHFLADALERDLGDVEGLAPTAEALLTDLAARQQKGGGWSYYVTGDMQGDGAPPNSISFTTAAAVIALVRAREAGLRVPDELLDPAVDALERMRSEDGTFAYFLFHESGATETGTADAGAVGRGPVCELALRAAGKSTSKRLRGALDAFLEQRHLFAAEQGKVLMHAGPDGQGCHYLLFDYAHAALTHEAVGGGAQARAKVRELVLACRQPDGSFLDTPVLGRAYGTAMALLALRALE